ncbi:MAG: FliH/SctL family protein [Planctomycetota bacterium]|jgi:flagellar assembly protein FliH
MVDNLIKVDKNVEITPVPFQFEDIQALAKKILERANEQAQSLMETARQQAVELEETAFADGLAKGQKEGYEKGLKEGTDKAYSEVNQIVSDKTDSLAGALSEILNHLSSERLALKQNAEIDLLRLSVEIARKVINHEVTVSEDIIQGAAREAISLTVSRRDVVLYVNSADYESLSEYLPALQAEFNDLERVSIEKDDSVAKGGIAAKTNAGEVDLNIDKQIAAIERALTGTGAQEQ